MERDDVLNVAAVELLDARRFIANAGSMVGSETKFDLLDQALGSLTSTERLVKRVAEEISQEMSELESEGKGLKL